MTRILGREYDFNEVMMVPQLTSHEKGLDSRSAVEDLSRTFSSNSSRPYTWSGVPIIAANMTTIGTFEMAKALFEYNCCTALHKHYSVDEMVEFFKENEEKQHLLFYTMGISDADLEKFKLFVQKYGTPKNVCIDVANGYMSRFPNHVERIRKAVPDGIIMAGNVVDSNGTSALINAGASIVKVGIGSGSACTTRRVTGVGRPQFSAVMDCANTAHGMNALICSDGGCVEPGDINKAIGGGADFVMLGGMLSGHDECGGKIVQEERIHFSDGVGMESYKTGPKKMEFYGMSSSTAMDRHNGGKADYRSSEGRTLLVPYRGQVSKTMEHILGGVRSNMLYIGAKHIKEIAKCATFVIVSQQLNRSLAQYDTKQS